VTTIATTSLASPGQCFIVHILRSAVKTFEYFLSLAKWVKNQQGTAANLLACAQVK
jgi:hypothetical protein